MLFSLDFYFLCLFFSLWLIHTYYFFNISFFFGVVIVSLDCVMISGFVFWLYCSIWVRVRMFGGGERQRYDGDFFLSSDDDISYLPIIFLPKSFLKIWRV